MRIRVFALDPGGRALSTPAPLRPWATAHRSRRWLLGLTALGVLCVGACADKRTPPAAGPQMVSLAITSVPPGAAVFEDGRDRLGKTPLVLKRAEGRRIQITVVKAGYKTARRGLFLVPGKTVKHEIHVRFVKATEEVLVDTLGLSGVRVTVDGTYIGRGPRRVDLTLGPHEILLEKAGFKSERRKIDLRKASAKQTVGVQLKPLRFKGSGKKGFGPKAGKSRGAPAVKK